jgi:hypothetical protein
MHVLIYTKSGHCIYQYKQVNTCIYHDVHSTYHAHNLLRWYTSMYHVTSMYKFQPCTSDWYTTVYCAEIYHYILWYDTVSFNIPLCLPLYSGVWRLCTSLDKAVHTAMAQLWINRAKTCMSCNILVCASMYWIHHRMNMLYGKPKYSAYTCFILLCTSLYRYSTCMCNFPLANIKKSREWSTWPITRMSLGISCVSMLCWLSATLWDLAQGT